MYGTRNVITPSLSTIRNPKDPSNLSIDHTTVGLYQYARAITPITMHKLHSVFISKILSSDSTQAYLVNTKSMKSELTEIPVKARDAWLSLDGLDDMLGSLGQEELRSLPVMINKHYLMLLHDDGKVITPVFNTDHIPEDMDVKYLRPITYYELLYIALVDTFDKYRAIITRYPVINLGGVYPSKIFVKTNEHPRSVIIRMNGKDTPVTQYPVPTNAYYNSLSPHPAFLGPLGADFDGDKVSFNVLYTDEALAEIDEALDSKEFYISPDNRLIFSPDTGTLKYTIAALNKGMVY